MKLAALAFAATLGLSGIAGAQPAGPGPVGPAGPYAGPPAGPIDGPAARPPGQLRQALLERFDRDRDGKLDAQERRHAIRALRRLAHRMAMQERRAAAGPGAGADAGARREARLRALVQRFDRNGDGVVSPDEVPPGVARKLQRLDRNGDGWLDARDARAPRDRAPRAPRDRDRDRDRDDRDE
jgi:hypothetical protein